MFQPEHRKVRGLSLTPLIDVVFLLLIFFMLASRFSVDQQLLLVTPNEEEVSQSEETPEVIEVRLQADGTIMLNAEMVDGRQLLPEVRKLAVSLDNPSYVIIAEKGAPVQSLVTAAEAARLAEISAVTMRRE